jgi:hypothetical protein
VIYALASRLRASWMGGKGNEGGQSFGEALEVLGETPGVVTLRRSRRGVLT